jgi:hypothetical protein
MKPECCTSQKEPLESVSCRDRRNEERRSYEKTKTKVCVFAKISAEKADALEQK